MAHDVFISHSSKDKTVADATCAWLESRGIRCWVAPRDIRPGATWGGSIINAIRNSRVMILIFSSHANASPQIKREVERAVHFGVAVIPMRIEDVLPEDDLEYFLGMPHWLDAFGTPLETHLDALAHAVKEILAMPAPATKSTSAETEPQVAEPLLDARETTPEQTGEPVELRGSRTGSVTPATFHPAPEPPPTRPSRKGWLIGLSLAVVALLLSGLGYYFIVTVPADKARQDEITKQEAIQKEKEAEAKEAADAVEKARLEAEAQKAAVAAEALRTQQEKQQEEAEHLANARGGLMVSTNPEGANVALGVEDVQTSPASFKSIKLGSYPIHIALDGYEPLDQTAEIKDNQFTDLGTISLVRSKGSIEITSDPTGLNYSISQNDTVITSGTTPATASDLPTGDYNVLVKNNNWEMKSTVLVERNKTTSYAPKFVTGSVSINSTPLGATVFSNGKELGKTPLLIDKAQPGTYTFSFSLSGYADGSASAEITPNGTATASATLEKYELSGTWSGTVVMTGKDYDTGEPIRYNAPIEITISRNATSLTIKSGSNPAVDVADVEREGNTLKWTWKLPDPGIDWLAYCTFRMTNTHDAAFIQDQTFVTGQAAGYKLHFQGSLTKQ